MFRLVPVLLAATLVLVCGCRGSATTTPIDSVPPSGVDAATPLTDLLQRLAVTDEVTTGYARTEFRLWTDDDGDGCNTREEVLIAQSLELPTVTGVCDVVRGAWFSEYDGLRIVTPSEVEIDHVVPLAEAWESGASSWSPARREAYANDLGVPWALIAVSAASNRAKGASDPTEWLPPRSADLCPYLAAWIGVKSRWGLSVDADERVTLADLVRQCPDTRLAVPPAPT